MKIGYLSADWGDSDEEAIEEFPVLSPGGAAWYRIWNHRRYMQAAGHETIVGEQVALEGTGAPFIMDWHQNEAGWFDILVMQRVMHEFAEQVAREAKFNGVKVVNDIDDWFWGLHKDNMASNYMSEKDNPDSNLVYYKRCIRESNLVTCSTPFLVERMQEWGLNAVLVRNAIDLDRWEMVAQARKPVVGWVGTTSHRSGDLETLRGVLPDFLEENDLKFFHHGHNFDFPRVHEMMGFPAEREMVPSLLCPITQYHRGFSAMDIGLVPLNKIDFNEAKSSIKGMEYAAAGIPFIAQDTGEYVWMAEEHGIGRIASTEADWKRHLTELLDRDVRNEEAAENRRKVEALSIENNWKNWEEIYANL